MLTLDQEPAPGTAPVLFIGHSPGLRELTEWAARHGFTPIGGQPDRTVLCAVADDDTLHGSGDADDATLVQRVHDLDLPCLNPSQASAFLASAIDTYRGNGTHHQADTSNDGA